MGFGYVFLGYLISFVIYATVEALSLGGLALLVGYGIMLSGLWVLAHYQSAFSWAKYLLFPLLGTALYDCLISFGELFAFDLGVLTGEIARAAYTWVTFLLLMLFQLALLFGIRMIAKDVGLKQIEIKALRNAIFVGIYGILYALAQCLPRDSVKGYLALPLVLLQLLYVILNLVLLVNCAKDICPAGEEDLPPKRSRFAILNRISDTFERNRQKAIDRTLQETEDKLRERRESREKKKIQHSKHKK